jgi:hypothetical protein
MKPIKPIKNKPIKKPCSNCGKSKVLNNFYKSKNTMFDGSVNICSACIKESIDYNDMNTVFNVLQRMDIMFDHSMWKSALESPRDTIGRYMSMANSMNQFDGKTWKDSIFGDEIKKQNEMIKPLSVKTEFVLTDEIENKWGFGFEPVELYEYFEKKYKQLKNNYVEKTSMHTESLKKYIIYQVRAEIATAKGFFVEAEKWSKMANEAAKAGNINPNQLTKVDLSDGVETFSELSRMVEKAVDIIPILPKFKEKPQDKVDFTILCYVNYIRNMMNLPEATYPELYEFYKEKREQHEDELEFLRNVGEEDVI